MRVEAEISSEIFATLPTAKGAKIPKTRAKVAITYS